MTSSNGKMVARISAKYSDDKPAYLGRVTLDSSPSRRAFAKKLAKRCQVSEDDVEEELLRIAEEQATQPMFQEPPSPPKPELTPEQRQEAIAFLSSPTLIDDIASDIARIGVEGERDLALLTYVILTSRILSDPLGGIIQGSSSAGKSYVARTVAELIPEESRVCASSFSEHAWFYFAEQGLRHKAVVLGERKQGSAPEIIDEGRALRELLSEKALTRIVAIRDRDSGRFTSVPVTVEGPIAYLESTTKEKLIEEDASRVLPLRPDESKGQTQAIMSRIARDAESKTVPPEERAAIVRKHHAAQRLLEELTEVSVRVPYASAIFLPADKVVARRAYGHLISVIKAVAVLRVFQKSVSDRDPIVADLEDYEIAYELMGSVIRRQLCSLSDADEALFQSIEKRFGCKRFITKDIEGLLGVSDRHARRRLDALVENDLIEETSGSRRNRKVYHIRKGAAVGQADAWLPRPYDVEERYAIQHENDPE